MAFNRDNLAAVRLRYETKHLEAEHEADLRRAELQRVIPGLSQIDAKLNLTGSRLMKIALKKSGETFDEVQNDVQSLRAERDRMLREHGFPADYSDVRYSCPICSDSGYTDGRMCSCMRRELIMAGYESSGIAELIRRCRFDNFDTAYYREDKRSYDNMCRIRDELRKYAEEFGEDSPNLVLFGNTGLGKTHLAVAVTGRVIERGFDAVYTGAVGMFSDFEKARFGSSGGTESGNGTDRYFDCELLVIDDLGSEISNQFTVACLYEVINRRLNLRRPVIITTNLNNRELGRVYTDRIVSRIFGEYKPFLFTGRDVRLQKLSGGSD